jgi:hypothetical protein
MEQDFKVTVKYKKIYPIFMLSASLFILYVSLLVGFSVNTITGLVLLIISILMLTRPIAVITPNTIQMMNLMGMTVNNYHYNHENIAITNNSILVGNKKVISNWWADINMKQARELMLTK